jgi:hypothetical protein
MGTAAKVIEAQTNLKLYDPTGHVDQRYDHWLTRTGSPEAAATLVLAEIQSANYPGAKGHPVDQRNSDSLNPVDVAKELRVSPDTVLHWVRTKQLAAANIATGSRPRWIIKRSDLDVFLQTRQSQPKEKRRKRVSLGDVETSFRKYRD